VELNTRTKVAGGVLALALAALIYDRVILGGPASASAAPVADQAPPSREPPRKQVQESAFHGALATRLETLAASLLTSQEKDAFVAPAAWFPPDPEPEQTVVVQSHKDEPRRRLTSVVADSTGRGRAAVIDGKLFQVGVPQTIEGTDGRKHRYELVRAWFEGKVGRAMVRVDGRVVELTTAREDGSE
jgi:hypothetical protein